MHIRALISKMAFASYVRVFSVWKKYTIKLKRRQGHADEKTSSDVLTIKHEVVVCNVLRTIGQSALWVGRVHSVMSKL